MQHIALIDSYDSFTHLLKYYFINVPNVTVHVMRNDAINYDVLNNCHKIVLSPGAGLPAEAGQLMQLINEYHTLKPMLGICLGHQALAQYFGGQLYNLSNVVHGQAHAITVKQTNPLCNSKLFTGLPLTYNVGRYHSWAANINNVACLNATAHCPIDGAVMAMEHISLPIVGVQFHPESVLSEHGQQLIKNFINLY
jgi:anthranilate synthase component II